MADDTTTDISDFNAAISDSPTEVTNAVETASTDLATDAPTVVTIDETLQACIALIRALPDTTSVNLVMLRLRNNFGG